jgi:hypothetical protein
VSGQAGALRAQAALRAILHHKEGKEMLSKKLITIGFVAIIVFEFGCKDRGVEPPPPPKDPRAYVFTVDTLAYPDAFQTNMQDIAGTSANNVFTVGHNSSSRAGTMFRFDGTSWKTTGFSREEGGPIEGTVDLSSLIAFSASDIWFVGTRFQLNPTPPPNFIDSSFILHYDGRNWQEHKAYGGRLLLSIHGIAPNDIWACGFYGTLLHYNGVQWERDSIPLAVPEDWFFALTRIAVASTQDVYAIGQMQKLGELTRFYFFRSFGGSWNVVDSVAPRGDAEVRWGASHLWSSPSGTLYSVGGVGVYRWDGTRWIKMLDSPQPLSRIWGYSDNSFFVGGYQTLLHYNGKDFFQYPGFTNNLVTGIWGDGEELFVVANDGNKSYVFHGR